MYRATLTSQPRAIRVSLMATALLLLALSTSGAAQKTALHLDGTPADPFLAASGKPVVLVFVRADCPISNRYAPLIQRISRSEEHTSELQSLTNLVCRLLLEKKNT